MTTNAVTTFKFPHPSLPEIDVRVTGMTGEPWWFAADVCKAVDVINVSQAVARLDDDEKATIRLTDSGNLNAERTIINEAGLYSLIMTSRKPVARVFKKWVTGTVLPTIRKTGSFNAAPSLNLDSPVALRAALLGYTEKNIERISEDRAQTAAQAISGLRQRQVSSHCAV